MNRGQNNQGKECKRDWRKENREIDEARQSKKERSEEEKLAKFTNWRERRNEDMEKNTH